MRLVDREAPWMCGEEALGIAREGREIGRALEIEVGPLRQRLAHQRALAALARPEQHHRREPAEQAEQAGLDGPAPVEHIVFLNLIYKNAMSALGAKMAKTPTFQYDAAVLARIGQVATVVLMVGYPVVVYLGLSRWQVRTVAIVLLVLLGTGALIRARGLDPARLRAAFVPVLPTVVLAAIAGALDRRWALLLVPVLVNLGLLATFAASLRAGKVPMVERFARLREPELPKGGVVYCRAVTKVWIGFFAVNAAISGALALWAPFAWWTLWCGALAYGCIGLVFAIEIAVRRRRFGPARGRA